MRHGKKLAKLGRTSAHRKAMLANLVTSLFEKEVLHTTDARAKELRRTAEHMITFAKRRELHARRQVLRLIPNKKVVAKLFEELADRYKSRNGGYTRIVKMGPRRGDGALMSIVELVDRPDAGAVDAPAAKRKVEDEAREEVAATSD